MKRVGLIFVGLLLAACLVAAPAIAGKKDDTLVWATDRDNPIADPFYLNTRELVVIGHHVWDTLVIIDPKTAEIKPLLATKWKWVDPTTLEMELRKGVKFHSGKALDADDVVYTLNHVANKDNAIANYALLAWIKDAEKIDASKVRINLRNPFPPALAYLAGLGFIMQKGHYDKRAGEARRQEGLRRRQAQRHRPLQGRRGEARRLHPDGEERRLLQGRLQGRPQDLQDQVPHHQGRQHARGRADDRRHRLDLGRAQGPGRAHQGQPGARGGERQDAARLLSAVRCRTAQSGQKFFTDKRVRQARRACDRPRVAHQEPGRPGLGRRARRLPSRPVRAARAT